MAEHSVKVTLMHVNEVTNGNRKFLEFLFGQKISGAINYS